VPSKTGPNLKRLSGTKTDGKFRVLFSVPKEAVSKKRMQNARKKKKRVFFFIYKILIKTSARYGYFFTKLNGYDRFFKLHALECQGTTFLFFKP
jgi:hypothetical protein